MYNAITDIEGILVGQAGDPVALTGCTVVICPQGAVAGVDVRGGAPGTRETDALHPLNLVDRAHAVVLTGGSAFGLDAASGVMKYLEEQDIGFDVGITRVPIVTAAVLFDLGIGDFRVRPDAAMGYKAAASAGNGPVEEGNTGAGTGATVGKILGLGGAMKSGQGTAAMRVGDLVVGALVAVNALGDVVDPATGEIIARALTGGKAFLDTEKYLRDNPFSPAGNIGNTTIGALLQTPASPKPMPPKLPRWPRTAMPGLSGRCTPCGGTHLLSGRRQVAAINRVGSLPPGNPGHGQQSARGRPSGSH